MASSPSTSTTTATEFFSRYVIEDPNFAKGSYGKVSLARDKKGKQVVIKTIPKNVASNWIKNELEAGDRLKEHPNLVKLVDQHTSNNFHYLVFDFFKGVELFELLELQDFKPMEESDAKFIFRQVIDGLEFGQQHGICHRDIKLENILINKQLKVAIVDFGLSSFSAPSDYVLEDQRLLSREFVGSENYTAPEIIKRTPYDPFRVDVWSCAVVLYCLLFGQFPWDKLETEIELSSGGNRQPKIRFPKDVQVSDSAKQLLVQMLDIDPATRISLKSILNHDWLKSDDS